MFFLTTNGNDENGETQTNELTNDTQSLFLSK